MGACGALGRGFESLSENPTPRPFAFRSLRKGLQPWQRFYLQELFKRFPSISAISNR